MFKGTQKKVISLLIALVMLVALLAGCGGGAPAATPTPPTAPTDTAPTDAADPAETTPDWPTRPVTLITRQAGGGADVALRVLQPALSEVLGVNVIVENIDGAAGAIAISEALNRAPDGYSFGVAFFPTKITLELIQGNEWNALETTYVVNITRDLGNVLCVAADSPIETWDDIVAIGQTRPVTVAVSGMGSMNHLVYRFMALAFPEVQFTDIPFNSGGESATAIAGGHVDMGIAILTNVVQMIHDDMIRPLAWSGPERHEMFPDMPAFQEFTGREIFEVLTQIGMFAPAGTPDHVVQAMNEAVRIALEDEGVIASFADLGLIPFWMSPEDFTEWVHEYYWNIYEVKHYFVG